MKDLRLILCIALLFAIACGGVYFRAQDGHVSINCDAAALYMLKGGYRSWAIDYSWGQTWDRQGKPYHLWHWPTFRHLDIRKLRINDTSTDGMYSTNR